jgi:hypothetical protein
VLSELALEIRIPWQPRGAEFGLPPEVSFELPDDGEKFRARIEIVRVVF